jgi:general stress protein 26
MARTTTTSGSDGAVADSKTASGVRKPAPTRGQNAPETQTAKEQLENVDRVWELAEKIGICMFVTWDGERQRARPLAATLDREAHAIWFLTDVDGHKDDEAEAFPKVTLAFADNPGSKYVTITGRAEIFRDEARIKELWSPFAKAWWDSPEDPGIRVIKVTPEDAELWDTPNGLLTRASFVVSAVTGAGTPKIAKNAKVDL